METRFIGLDGFGEIENLQSSKKRETKNNKLNTAQKILRFIKRAFKFSCELLIREIKRLLSLSFEKLTKFFSVDKNVKNKRYVKDTSQTAYKAHTFIRKKAMLAFSVCCLVVVMSFITVSGAVDLSEFELLKTGDADMSSPCYYNKYVDNYEINRLGAFSTADEAFNDLNTNARKVITKALIEDNIQSDCVGLYIDNQFIGATSDAQKLNDALEQVLVDYREGYDAETTTEFANNVETRNGRFDESQIKSVSEIMKKAEGMFSIALATDIIYTKEIAYDVKTEYDDSQPLTYENIKTEGENGEEKVTVRTVYVDGVQTDAYQTDSSVIKEAVDEVVVKGGSNLSDESSSSIEMSENSSNASSYGSGSFIWPLPYTHNLTSYFGTRWGRLHGGLDISDGGVYGQPIIASDSGTVILAGNQGDGYGNYVIIDHGNGYKTLYGHMSAVAAYTGQQVAQGEVIGYVGSTGNSTGPHLHFEIRVNDVQTDPLQYVS